MARRHTCAHCPETFPTVSGHMAHVHAAHPDRIATGTRSPREWSCWACAKSNPPNTTRCHACGWQHPHRQETPQ